MSWYIKAIIPAANVRAVLQEPQYQCVPQSLKDTITSICDEIVKDTSVTKPNAVMLVTGGHFGGAWSSVGEFRCEPFTVELAAFTPPPAPEPPQAAPAPAAPPAPVDAAPAAPTGIP